jgi:hypothetical protein
MVVLGVVEDMVYRERKLVWVCDKNEGVGDVYVRERGSDCHERKKWCRDRARRCLLWITCITISN